MCLVLTSSNTSSSAFYLNMCQRSANSAEWMRNESICRNSAAFLRQKRDYLDIQRGICKEPSGKEFCQDFCAPVSLVYSLPHSLTYSKTHRYYVGFRKLRQKGRMHRRRLWQSLDRVIAGSFSCLLSLSTLTGHLLRAPHPHLCFLPARWMHTPITLV